MVPSMKLNTVSFQEGENFQRVLWIWRLGFFLFVFPLQIMHSVFDIGWNMALEPDYSVSVVLLDSVAELSMLRLRMCLYFVMVENT